MGQVDRRPQRGFHVAVWSRTPGAPGNLSARTNGWLDPALPHTGTISPVTSPLGLRPMAWSPAGPGSVPDPPFLTPSIPWSVNNCPSFRHSPFNGR